MGLKEAIAAHGWRADAVSPEEAVARIPAGAAVYIGGGCAVPETVVRALEAAADSHPGVRILHHMAWLSDKPFSPALRHRAMAVGPQDVDLIAQGRTEYIPMRLSELPSSFAEKRVDIDVAVVQVSPPDTMGQCSLGISVGVMKAAIELAPLVIAEVNPAMPRARGAALVPYSAFDAVVVADHPLATYRWERSDTSVEQIARYIARLVADGSTLHVGMGWIPTAVLGYLGTRRDLGIHTSTVTDAVLDLLDQGVITGREKSMSRGRVVASFAMGSERLYERVADDSAFSMRPLDQVTDPDVLRRQHRLVSLAQAAAADLTGQVTVEALDGKIMGGVGSLPLVNNAAARSPGGRAIICLPAVDVHGRSAIRPTLDPVEGVTIPRYDVRWIVTEYGTAYLHGKSLGERAVAMIEIAHPDHRAPLLSEAKRLGLLPADQTLRSRRGYPVEEERSVTLRDGREVLLRPTRTTDASKLQDLFYALDTKDVYTRFFRYLSSLTRQAAEHLCSVNYTDEMAFAATTGDVETGEEIVATSCYFVDQDTGLADVAYLVRSDYQRQGLGSALHERTVEYAQQNGIRGFSADILEGNAAMLAVFARGPGHLSSHGSHGVYEIELLFEESHGVGYTTGGIPRMEC